MNEIKNKKIGVMAPPTVERRPDVTKPKRKKVKPNYITLEKIFGKKKFYVCPKCQCDIHIAYNPEYCGKCGVSIDWSDDHEQ